jgi:uncharacterized protein
MKTLSPRALVLLLLLVASSVPLVAAPNPQFGLPMATLRFGTNVLTAQIAANEETRERGLMSRTNLAENEGMVFVFPTPRPVAFWMKDTLIPLSIAYVGSSGRIFEIHDLKPHDETPVPSASSAVLSAIEAPLGWFGRHGILAGDIVEGVPSASSAR